MRPQAAHFFALASSLFLHALIKSVSAFSFALAALAASAFGSGGLSFLGIEMKVFAVSVGEDTRDEIAGSLCHACSVVHHDQGVQPRGYFLYLTLF